LTTFQDIDNYRLAQLKSFSTFNFTNHDSVFYSWECVSLIRPNSTTLDFVIKDPTDLMFLLHVL
jgi:hypothetical protein